ncbi:hypothetical protein BDV98DRAFT_575266 [Pterulicium gracile]|uniref:Uncharacterized protein n=1 Tax=Pterulicium gracile TaxID=1884261 RepID=A0A5C3QF80_9AGAR|nr:hypothetical protein BDV98DRAFT_575266 [Pterula gracilis]
MHKTFVDYLSSTSAGRFHIRMHEAHHSAFIHCYKNMKSSLHFNMGSIRSSYDLDEENPGLYDRVKAEISQQSKYAYQHWATHLAAPGNIALDDLPSARYGQTCSSLLRDFLWLKVLFWMETMNLLRQDCRNAIGLAKLWAEWINVRFLEHTPSCLFQSDTLLRG